MPNPKLPDKLKKKVLSLHNGKRTCQTVADMAGVSLGTVVKVWREAGKLSPRKKLSTDLDREIKEKVKEGMASEDIGARLGVDRRSVDKRLASMGRRNSLHDPMPKAIRRDWQPYAIDTPGAWGIICDLHVPTHDEETVELFLQKCEEHRVVGIILNGDFLDCHELSVHDKDPSMPRYVEEIEDGKKFLKHVRSRFPKIPIVLKHGNHEERVQRYLGNRAPALALMEGVNIGHWLHLDEFKIEEVRDRRVIHVGHLHLIHGHEYRGTGGVNPARWLYLKARSRAACGHFHRKSEHRGRNIARKYEAAWSIGCACDLAPAYAPLNEWDLGCAFVHLEPSGDFAFENLTVMHGKLV